MLLVRGEGSIRLIQRLGTFEKTRETGSRDGGSGRATCRTEAQSSPPLHRHRGARPPESRTRIQLLSPPRASDGLAHVSAGGVEAMTSAVETQGEARPVESEVPMAQRQGHRETAVWRVTRGRGTAARDVRLDDRGRGGGCRIKKPRGPHLHQRHDPSVGIRDHAALERS